MKKSIVFAAIIIFVAVFWLSADEFFNAFKSSVQKIVPAKFILNEGRSWGRNPSYRLEFNGDKDKMEILVFSLSKKATTFSEIDKAGNPESYTWEGRPAIFADGNKAGMGTLSVILKNNGGKFTISHRIFGGTFLTKAEMEGLLTRIGLEQFEK